MNSFDDLRRVTYYLDCANFCRDPHSPAHLDVRLHIEIPADTALYIRLSAIRKDLA